MDFGYATPLMFMARYARQTELNARIHKGYRKGNVVQRRQLLHFWRKHYCNFVQYVYTV